MSVLESRVVEETLRLIAESRERAERAAREVADSGGQAHVAEALKRVDVDLTKLYKSLLDDTLFHAEAAPERQLALDAAA